MIKRLLATACAAVMLMTLAACGDKSDQKDEASESGSQKAATLSVEKTFEKEFEAAKSFDIDALAEVEYFINFGNGVDKEKYIEQSKASLAQLGEGELDKYIEAQKDLTYIITDQTALKDDALKKRIKGLAGIAVPLIFSSLDHIDLVSNAMDLRGFGKNPRRTWYSARPFQKADYAVMIATVLLSAAGLYFTFRGGSRFYNPFL